MPDENLFKNFGPWNPKGLEIFGAKEDIERKNRLI